MKTLRGVFAFLALTTAALALPEPAACAYCSQGACYGPCGDGCLCITTGTISKCVGAERALQLVDAGAAVLR